MGMAIYRSIISLLLLSFLALGFNPSYHSFAQEIGVNNNLSQIKKKTDFKLLSPQNIEKKWEVVIKPYPSAKSNIITSVRLSYLDKKLNDYVVVGIEQTKGNKISNVGNIVDINGSKGRFEAWAEKDKIGGLLRWVQGNTHIEMNSTNLTKDEMLELAKSFK